MTHRVIVQCALCSRYQPSCTCRLKWAAVFSKGKHLVLKLLMYSPWKMSSAGSSAVTPQHVKSERANWWDQNGEIFQWHKALTSEVKKGKKKWCLYRIEIQGCCLIFILSTCSCSGGGEPSLTAIFINEYELCLNPLFLSLSFSVSHSLFEFICFFVFASISFYSSLDQSVIVYCISVLSLLFFFFIIFYWKSMLNFTIV